MKKKWHLPFLLVLILGTWLAYQQKLSQAYRVAGSSLFSQADEAFRLYSLAVAGEASLSGMNRLNDVHADLAGSFRQLSPLFGSHRH